MLSIAGFYTARMLLAVTQWQDLSGFEGVSPAYLAFTGLVWALVAWTLGWGLWRGKTWAPPLARMAAVVFSIYYWLDQIARTSRQAGTLSLPIYAPFAAVVNLLCLLWLVWVLSKINVKAYFGEFHERKS